jgi:hypothetical protein
MKRCVTGRWHGMFSYASELAAVGFDAELQENDGQISGLIEEVDDDGSGPTFLTAVINGTRRGRDVEFRKTYDEFAPVCVVDYSGVLEPEGDEIAGEWVRLGDLQSGPFVMRRSLEDEESEQLAAERPSKWI